MTHRKVRKEVINVLYIFSAVILVGLFTISEYKIGKQPEKKDYVNKTIFENDIPVIAEQKKITRPYIDSSIKIATNYYNSKDDEATQQNSLIFYENTYIQSTGIDYQSDYDFDVVAALDGVIITVKEDQILGKIVEIKHENNIITSYQSLSEILVKEGENIKQGALIGKSGTSNLQKNMGSHLHFELSIDSKNVDPEEYYDKELVEIN